MRGDGWDLLDGNQPSDNEERGGIRLHTPDGPDASASSCISEVEVSRFGEPLEPILPARRPWESEYIRRLWITDTAAVLGAVAFAHWTNTRPISISSLISVDTVVSMAVAILWLLFLGRGRSRSSRVVGTGLGEYLRVVVATARLFGLVAVGSLLFNLDGPRGYLVVALPVGTVALLAGRLAWRAVVVRRRRLGRYRTSVLLVGGHASAVTITRSFAREPSCGYDVAGVCIPRRATTLDDRVLVDGQSIPVFGNELDVVQALRICGADTVIVTAAEDLGQVGMRTLMWALEPHGIDLVVSPVVADVARPRLMMRSVAGLSLIHIGKPRYKGAKRLGKAIFDFWFAVLALVVAAPVMAVAALAVKTTSRGPVFYRAERIGTDGKPFFMFKFRTMVEGADRQVVELMGDNEGAGGVLFKMRRDPRVTRVGRVLRRYSIDEFPQFLNVIRQEMSVVGPRPPLRREVATYDDEVARRLLVKPGVTGLWQVSGRSDLSWEESVRLDTFYVENWSMSQDLAIIARTFSAVVSSAGAY